MKYIRNKVIYNFFGIRTYHLTYSKEFKYSWFRIAKNGTRSFLKIINDNMPPDIDKYHVPYFAFMHKNNYKFTVIRNPYDRIVSTFKNKVLKEEMYPECWGKDFDYFIGFVSRNNLDDCNDHIMKQTKMFPTKHMDYIGRFEQLNDEIDIIFNQHFGLDITPVHLNKTFQADYRSFYTPELRKRVTELYLDDIRFGNYEF